MANSPITELDFLQIKNNLKEFLKGQTRFQDYNFEGSNLNVMLDVLAYNTFQNGFFTNMAINEMFLDSAQLRGSVVSHAKTLNYVPSSRTSAHAKINLTLAVNDSPNFVVVPAQTRFLAKCGNKSFNFYNDSAYTIVPVNGVYTIYGMDIFEGRYLNELFSVTASTPRYLISNKNVDINSVKVFIRDSADSAEKEYVLRTSVFGTETTDQVFYIQAYDEELYEVTFGNNSFGMQPSSGNIVRVQYRVSGGEEANGITSFASTGNIQGYPATVSLVLASEGGTEQETLESIKYFAPKALQIQDRAITESDYEIILRRRFPEIQAISVYGGEELHPPRYGRVVVAVDVSDADGISENTKINYAKYLGERSPIGIEPIITTPEFMFMNISTTVYYNTKTTDLSEADIRQSVFNAIINYSNTSLANFRVIFRTSRLSGAIDAADTNILSNDIETLPIIPLSPQLNRATNYAVSFNNQLAIDRALAAGDSLSNYKAALKSSSFTFEGSIGFMIDDGKGSIDIIKTFGDTFTILKKGIGTINYTTGEVVLRSLSVQAFTGSEIRLFGRTKINTITPPKNRILSIRPEDININVVGVN